MDLAVGCRQFSGWICQRLRGRRRISFRRLAAVDSGKSPVNELRAAPYPNRRRLTARAPSVWRTLRIGERAHLLAISVGSRRGSGKRHTRKSSSVKFIRGAGSAHRRPGIADLHGAGDGGGRGRVRRGARHGRAVPVGRGPDRHGSPCRRPAVPALPDRASGRVGRGRSLRPGPASRRPGADRPLGRGRGVRDLAPWASGGARNGRLRRDGGVGPMTGPVPASDRRESGTARDGPRRVEWTGGWKPPGHSG